MSIIRGETMRSPFGSAFVSFAFLLLAQSAAQATCRKVDASDNIRIDLVALKILATVGIDRAIVFESLKNVSIPETDGCWAGVSGNFDGQLLSAGVLQWNYGKNSLQPILLAYRRQFATEATFETQRDRLMPNYGKLIFSTSCLTTPIKDDCVAQLKGLETNDEQHRLIKPFQSEFDALLESNEMLQVQTDQFVRLLGAVRDDLMRLFPNRVPSSRQIKWAIDTKVQQGGFPTNDDIQRVRNAWSSLAEVEQQRKLLSLIKWYEGLSDAPDQDGTFRYQTNAEVWTKMIIGKQLSAEQIDLLQLTFLKSRTAQGQSGRWQANTFQRRAIAVFGAGCVAGQCFGI
jgi:hypothetical protein